MRKLILGLAAVALVAGSTPTVAGARCRDANGKFIKCPAKPAKPVACRDAKGKFAKCGTKEAKPA